MHFDFENMPFKINNINNINLNHLLHVKKMFQNDHEKESEYVIITHTPDKEQNSTPMWKVMKYENIKRWNGYLYFSISFYLMASWTWTPIALILPE